MLSISFEIALGWMTKDLIDAVLWISGRPVAKYDPWLERAIQHDPRSRPMGDPTLDLSGNVIKRKTWRVNN